MDWSVRRATPAEASAVRGIARESWHAAYDRILGPDRVDEYVDDWYAIDGLEESIRGATARDDATFLVAESDSRGDGRIRGFAHASADPDADAVADLHRLYVRPDAWGEGAGTALLERVETALAPVCDRLRLTVLADNEVGISFYESAGFERLETRPSDVGTDLEECIYGKPLPNPSR